jgi:hypothetical protein
MQTGVVKMDEAVQTFINELKGREDLLQLVTNTEFQLSFFCGNQIFRMAFQNGDVFLLYEEDELLMNNKISGKQKELEELLEGKETLRSLMRKKQLMVSAPFRTILLLESLFYLTKASGRLREII